MTDRTDGYLTDGHLTDEQLSSHLDEVEPTADSRSAGSPIDAHLVGCAPCRQRLAALDRVRAIMQTPVASVSPAVRAASIATVLRTAEARNEPAPVVRRRPQVLVGAAAAVLVLAVAIGVPLALSNHNTAASEASAPTTSVGQSLQPRRSSAAGTFAVPGFSAIPIASISNLGKVASVNALRSRVAGLLPTASSAVPSGQPTTGAVAPTPHATATTTSTTTANENENNNDNEFRVGAGKTANEFVRCLPTAEDAAEKAAGPAPTVQLLARATYKDTSSLVYVFVSQRSGSQLVVTALGSCKVLASTSTSVR
jgi:hypothetical protein